LNWQLPLTTAGGLSLRPHSTVGSSKQESPWL
jgi:hypothetical protein